MQNLDDILVFICVVETGSITAAAKKLKISPSVVSRRLSYLEESLKVDLVLRSTRRLSVSEMGREFYTDCSAALTRIEAARQGVMTRSDVLSGPLHVHSTLGMGQRLLALAVNEFLHAYPDISLELTVGSSPQDPLGEGYDVVVMNAKRWQLPEHHSVHLADIRYLVCAAPAYLQKHGIPRHPSELAALNCLIHLVDKPTREWRFREGREEIRVNVKGDLVANNGALLYEAAKGGLGIARMPDFAIMEDLRQGSLKVIFDNVVGLDRTLMAAVAPAHHQNRKIEAFLSFIQAFLSRQVEEMKYPGALTTACP